MNGHMYMVSRSVTDRFENGHFDNKIIKGWLD